MAFRTPPKQMSFSRELRMVLQERNLLSAKSREKVCSMLDESAMASSTPIDKSNESKGLYEQQHNCRRQAIHEIFTSEQSYLEQLELLLKFFVLPLKDKIDAGDHKLLFGQIEMIYNLNREFLRALEVDMDNVANAFLKLAPFFKFYSVYAFDYGKALLVLQDLTRRNSTFRKFLEQTESRPEVQRKLMSLLIVPIQRIPRYKLLLQQVLCYTSPSDVDYNPLRESIKQIEIVAAHINSSVQDQEITQALLNLQNSLCHHQPNIVQPSRSVLKEGVLQKVNRKGIGITRYCVLMSDIFMYCKILKDRPAKTLVENSLECCCIFPLNKCKVYELLPGNFKITCQGDGLIFSTLDLQLQRDWVTALQNAIEEHLQCRKTLRKESSKRTPLRRKAAKNFGTDYVLSPRAKRGEFDSIFRARNDSSSDSDNEIGETLTQKLNCFKTKHCSTNCMDIRCLKRQCLRDGCLKRCVPSISASSQSREVEENILRQTQILPELKRRIDDHRHPTLQKKFVQNLKMYDTAAVSKGSILKSKTTSVPPFPMHYNFLNCNIENEAFGSNDDVNYKPMKKRVKFNDLPTQRESLVFGDGDSRRTTTSIGAGVHDCMPFYRKAWNFVTDLLQKSLTKN